ncbi:hypothetical protein SPONL_1305 [uncultured Candidatus Thioglobus sp.]|nr:hypothetical protein SPONL_1305 [uncultured Candidatus Thioglobus sp.]
MTTDGIELFLEPGWMMLAILIITIFLADPDPDTLSEAKEDKE